MTYELLLLYFPFSNVPRFTCHCSPEVLNNTIVPQKPSQYKITCRLSSQLCQMHNEIHFLIKFEPFTPHTKENMLSTTKTKQNPPKSSRIYSFCISDSVVLALGNEHFYTSH